MKLLHRPSRLLLMLIFLSSSAQGCEPAGRPGPRPRVAPIIPVRAITSSPHDSTAFTQGLVFHRGILFESTGGYGTSSLRAVDPGTGRVRQLIELPDTFFAEGLTHLHDRLFQLTWHEHTGFIYDPVDLQRLGTFRYREEGWGITTDGELLIRSDGTDILRFTDPNTFQTVRTLQVHDGEFPVGYLNELEWVDGEVWANVWGDDAIARIDPVDGRVIGWLDLKSITPEVRYRNSGAVANGIAYDSIGGRIFITGKLWPTMVVIEHPADAPMNEGLAAPEAARPSSPLMPH